MAKLIQCVPNFSEGRRPEVVKKIADAIGSASNAKVIDFSLDEDHNRSVITFIGEPDDIQKSVLAGGKAAVELIDLNHHTGGHPRIGAMDVVPLVPLHDITMDETVAIAHQIGRDIADNLHIPVYFYERCALREHCVNLADIRRGGYEALKASSLVDGREPDLGPHTLHPTAGATVVGARGPLIAYNVNLATDNIHIARRIASKMRKLRNSGEALIGVKAIAVYLRSKGIAQVSTNITQPDVTGVYDVYSFVEREAKAEGVEILESELIGAMREEALVEAAKASMKMQGLSQKRILDCWM